MNTVKLYDLDAYATEFEAEVVSCTAAKKGFDVVLDQTLFFPEEGGQTPDTGTINDIKVKDVQIKDGVIHHYVKEEIHGHVKGKIDFAYRFSNMQNHSGEHIFSGIVHRLYGYDNVGFHLGDDYMSVDFSGPLNKEQLDDIEVKVNQVITDNRKILCYYPEHPEEMEYRSKKEINEAIRIVEIEGVDMCACCAPHVRMTGEIGFFKVLKFMKHKKGVRVFILCGKRALEEMKTVYDDAMKISNLLSVPPTETYKGVKRLNDENLALKQELANMKKARIDETLKSLEMKDYQLGFISGIDPATQRYYVNGLMDKANKAAAVFCETENGYYRYNLVSHEDARVYQQIFKEHFNVRGGGKADMIQGSIKATEEQLRDLFGRI